MSTLTLTACRPSLSDRARRLWRRWFPEKSELEHFAEDELRRAGFFDADSDYGGMMGPAVMKMLRQFSAEGHSGFSASIAIHLFEKLARFEPITPLTGADDEWTQVDDGIWQNKRCSRVFKDADGRAYDSQGIVFREPSGACFTSSDSRVYVTFPYTPKVQYVDVPAPGDPA